MLICVATVQWLSCNCEASRRDQLLLGGFTKLVMETIWNNMPALWSSIQLVHMIVGTTGIIGVQICMRNRMVCGRKPDFFEMLQLDEVEGLAKEPFYVAVNFWAWYGETVYWTSTGCHWFLLQELYQRTAKTLSIVIRCVPTVRPHDLWIVLVLHLRNEGG